MNVGQLLEILKREDLANEIVVGIEDDDNKYSVINRADISVDKDNEIYTLTLVVGEA